MITLPLNNGKKLITDAAYDSGSFLNFQLIVTDPDNWGNNQSLDGVLTKDEIKQLQVVLSGFAIKLINNKG